MLCGINEVRLIFQIHTLKNMTDNELSSHCEQGPVYLAEITPKNLRGGSMSITQVYSVLLNFCIML